MPLLASTPSHDEDDGRAFKAQLPWLTFVDDWSVYHNGRGEIHCGTNVRRTGTPATPWWTRLSSTSTSPTPTTPTRP